MVTNYLLEQLGDRPPTKMLPYMKGLDTWEQRSVIEMLASQKKWDTLTRETLFELVGHASADIRGAALEAVEKQTLKPEEYLVVEGYLTRQAADLRKGIVGMILKDKDTQVMSSADRLLKQGDRNQRLAGLELIRQMSEANRIRKACQERAIQFRAAQKKLTKEEETQLAAIAESDREVVSLDNAFGFMNPDGRSKVVQPQKKKVNLISKAAMACIKSLDDLIHQNRTMAISYQELSWLRGQTLG